MRPTARAGGRFDVLMWACVAQGFFLTALWGALLFRIEAAALDDR